MALMLCLLAALVMQQDVSKLPAYNPTGPKIVVTMQSGKSFEITTDPKNSPKTVAHILSLVRKRFYDRQRVHRVEHWVTQWGAPESISKPLDVMEKQKDGTMKKVPNEDVGDGGSGKDIPVFEMTNIDFVRGIVGIASTGPQVAGDSQLFILKKHTTRLDRMYACVGKVTRGMDVVDEIKRGDRIRSMRVLQGSR